MRHFKLFANCKIVKGAKRHLICDVQRSLYRVIDTNVLDIIEYCDHHSIQEIKKQFSIVHHVIIDTFLDKLVDEEYGFYCENPELFPNISEEWESPFVIHNAIIDYDRLEWKFVLKFLKGLAKLGCVHLQLRCYSLPKIENLNDLLKGIEDTRIRALDIIVPYDFVSENFQENVKELSSEYFKLNSVIVSSSPVQKIDKSLNTPISYVTQSINSELNCGLISPDFFTLDIEVFLESLNHNTCLNRKVSLSKEGQIKNCPSMSISFGNIKTVELEEAVVHPNFKKYWNIAKSEIEVCKDCEFRHICTDCRAYIEEPDNIYSKPLKCGYNPYTGEWSEWSTNPLKEKAIKHYGMEELVKIS